MDVNALAYVDRGLLGCRYGSSRPHHDIPLMVELYLSGKLMLDELVTEQRPLEGFREIVEDMEAGKLARGRAHLLTGPAEPARPGRDRADGASRPCYSRPRYDGASDRGGVRHGGRRAARRGRRSTPTSRPTSSRPPAGGPATAPDLRRSGTGPPTAWPGCLAGHGVARGSVVCLLLPELHRLHGLLRRRHPAGGGHLGDQPPPGRPPRSPRSSSGPVRRSPWSRTAARRPDGPGRRGARPVGRAGRGRRPGRPRPGGRTCRPTDPVAVVWTSGTTGLPKGAVFDHASLAAVAAGTDVLSEPGDRRLSPLPFAHVGLHDPHLGRDRPRGDHGDHARRRGGRPTPSRILAERADHRGPGGAHPVGAGAGPPRSRRSRPARRCGSSGTGASRVPPELVAAMRERFGVPGGGALHLDRGLARAPAPCPATPTRWWPPPSAGRCPGSS